MSVERVGTRIPVTFAFSDFDEYIYIQWLFKHNREQTCRRMRTKQFHVAIIECVTHTIV